MDRFDIDASQVEEVPVRESMGIRARRVVELVEDLLTEVRTGLAFESVDVE